MTFKTRRIKHSLSTSVLHRYFYRERRQKRRVTAALKVIHRVQINLQKHKALSAAMFQLPGQTEHSLQRESGTRRDSGRLLNLPETDSFFYLERCFPYILSCRLYLKVWVYLLLVPCEQEWINLLSHYVCRRFENITISDIEKMKQNKRLK